MHDNFEPLIYRQSPIKQPPLTVIKLLKSRNYFHLNTISKIPFGHQDEGFLLLFTSKWPPKINTVFPQINSRPPLMEIFQIIASLK